MDRGFEAREEFWNGRLGGLFAPWMPFWTDPMKQGFDKAGKAMPSLESARAARTFGIQVGALDEALVAQLELNPGEGLMIRDVEKAGLKRYDVVLSLNGKAVQGAAEFRKELRDHLDKGVDLQIVCRGTRGTVRVEYRLDPRAGGETCRPAPFSGATPRFRGRRRRNRYLCGAVMRHQGAAGIHKEVDS